MTRDNFKASRPDPRKVCADIREVVLKLSSLNQEMIVDKIESEKLDADIGKLVKDCQADLDGRAKIFEAEKKPLADRGIELSDRYKENVIEQQKILTRYFELSVILLTDEIE